MTSPTDDTAPSDSERHNAKMARKKQARDKIMATKTDEKGLIIVHTGKGKGKSSAAFGMIFRCIAHQLPCAVVQFIKGDGYRRAQSDHREFSGAVCLSHHGRRLYLGDAGPGARHRRRQPPGKRQRN